MAYTLDEFIKLNKGYTKAYDPATQMATVTNSGTGKSVGFKSGQGSEYGFGGVENGSNIISDMDKFNSAFGVSKPSTNYQSPYSKEITDTLSAISNRPAFSYNAASDQGLVAAQDNAMSAVNREAARRGMVYSDSNKSQLGKSSLALIPQFEQAAYNKYQQQGSDLNNQLSTLSGLESQNFNMFDSNRGFDLNSQNQTFNQNMATNQYNQSTQQQQFSNDLASKQFDESLRQNDISQSNWQQQALANLAKAKSSSSGSSSGSGTSNTVYDNTLALWKTLGVANQSIADVLGVPVGAKTADYDLATTKASNPTTSEINSTEDKSLDGKISTIMNDFKINGYSDDAILSELYGYASEYINDIGSDAYWNLVSKYENRTQ